MDQPIEHANVPKVTVANIIVSSLVALPLNFTSGRILLFVCVSYTAYLSTIVGVGYETSKQLVLSSVGRIGSWRPSATQN